MIGERFNFEDVFFRDLTVCVLDTLEGEVRWVNKFSSGDRVVNVPFYYSLTGDERFLLDSFTDDVVSNSRYVDLNTDIIPRGHLTLTSYEIRGDEFANPNVWLKMVVENETEIRNMLTKVRAIPITVKYDLVIFLSSEIDTFKCSQAIMDTLWLYRFMYFEHNFMNIDAVMQIPDSNNIEINREKNLTSDNTIKLTVSFDVQTYYPAFRKPKLPDVLPYNVGSTNYYNKTLAVRVDLIKPNSDYLKEQLAKTNLISLGPVPITQKVSMSIDYPQPNSEFITNFNFTTTNSVDQSTELANFINTNTLFSAKSSGTNVKITAPPGSGANINNDILIVRGVFPDVVTTPFSGGIGGSATSSVGFGESIPTTSIMTLFSDYPEPNTVLVGNFTFSSTTTTGQATELANLINTLTDYTASVDGGTNLVIAATQITDPAISNKNISFTSDIPEISVPPFDGGSEINESEADVVFSESHIITTSSDGSMVIPIGSGGKIKGNYLNVNLKESGLKVDVYVDPTKESNFTKIISGDDLPVISSSVVDDINQIASNAFSLPNSSGDFRDIITLPKRTRWYNNLLNTKGTVQKTTTPYSSQNLNNQKKI